MIHTFEEIRVVGRNAFEGLGRTGRGNRTLIAVDAAVVPDLQEQRAVTKGIAAFDAFAASVAKGLVDLVFVVRIFDVFTQDRAGGTGLVFRSLGQGVRFGVEETEANLAVSADRVHVRAFHGRIFQDAVRRAVATGNALIGIDLPDPILPLTSMGGKPHNTPETGQACAPEPVPEQSTACDIVISFGHDLLFL